jgi:hypothetical protein
VFASPPIGGSDCGDDLGVRVDRDLALVAVELVRSSCGRAGIGVDREDDPVSGDATGDPPCAVVVGFSSS